MGRWSKPDQACHLDTQQMLVDWLILFLQTNLWSSLSNKNLEGSLVSVAAVLCSAVHGKGGVILHLSLR